MKRIETLEQWKMLSEALTEKGYRLWQMQYSWNMPDGFHAWFWKSGKQDVEVVTHSKDVHTAIILYKS